MTTKTFINNVSIPGNSTKGISRGRREISGFISKTALVALVLLGLAAAGFIVRVKGKSLSESVLPALPSPQSPASPAGELSPLPAGTPDPGEAPQAISMVAPTASTLPAPAPATAVAPSAPKTAPAGMVYLAKRITVTKETGLASFPRGTLVVVKSRAGGKIRGSINGVNVELSEAQATSVLQD